jgi:hypothetical protein
MSSAALGNLVRRRAAGSANDAWRNVGAEVKASPNRMYAVALKRSARNDDAAQPLRSCRLNNLIDRVRIDVVAALRQRSNAEPAATMLGSQPGGLRLVYCTALSRPLAFAGAVGKSVGNNTGVWRDTFGKRSDLSYAHGLTNPKRRYNPSTQQNNSVSTGRFRAT